MSIEVEAFGKYALFTEPFSKMGGEKTSYSIPTYSAIVGLMESIYWRPTFYFVIEKIRIMNKIQRWSKGALPINIDKSQHYLSIYTFLYDVRYQIQARTEWNTEKLEFKNDRNYQKHSEIFQRWLKRGGHLLPYFGTKECSATVNSCNFGEGKGYYDGIDLEFDSMLFRYDFRTKTRKNFVPIMKNGIIDFGDNI